MVERFCVKFVDPSCIGCRDIVRTNRQTAVKPHYPRLHAVDNDSGRDEQVL